MEMGQPALLYLVPCTLLPTVYLGWRRGDLAVMWRGHHQEPAKPADIEAQSLLSEDAGDDETKDPDVVVNLAPLDPRAIEPPLHLQEIPHLGEIPPTTPDSQ